ncbi:MAG: AtpZ/AtpI family protein [Phycisphaeraceae bacterium]|nr:AtpZ/AtpI family protein [Phycisphaeraceae bacterium]
MPDEPHRSAEPPPLPDFPATPSAPTAAPGTRSTAKDPQYQVYALGLEWVVYMAAAGGLGYLIDWWLRCAPWGLSIGLLLGVLGGGYRFVRAAIQMSQPRR